MPAVLPVVLHNGTTAWRAARDMTPLIEAVGPRLAAYQPAQRFLVLDLRHARKHDLPPGILLRALAGLEQSRTPDDLLRVVQALLGWLRDPRTAELRRAFADWVRQMAERLAPDVAALPVLKTLEDARMTSVERVGEWPAQWLREGREEGRVEGRVEGREEGRQEGRAQGLAHERALLCRMAATRFGADTAERLGAPLAPAADPDHLADIGDSPVRCNSADEFLAQADSSRTT